jgi:hypothetical protein
MVTPRHQAHQIHGLPPQTDGQIEVVNMMIVHILHMYTSRHPRLWDESLPYVQHNYNRAIHSSTDQNSFQMGLGFQPLGPMDVALPLASTQEESSHAQTKVDKATWFTEKNPAHLATYSIYFAEVQCQVHVTP